MKTLCLCLAALLVGCSTPSQTQQAAADNLARTLSELTTAAIQVEAAKHGVALPAHKDVVPLR